MTTTIYICITLNAIKPMRLIISHFFIITIEVQRHFTFYKEKMSKKISFQQHFFQISI